MNIDHPYHFDASGRTALASEAAHVRDMIEQLLFTSPGERVNQPDLGSPLRRMVFSENSSEVAAAVQFTTQAALQRWLGDVIAVHQLTAEATDATLTVTLVYAIRTTGEQRTDTFIRSAAP